jgi:hypothetical protein
MATYTELNTLSTDAALLARVKAAVAIAADTIRQESSGAANNLQRKGWAREALKAPEVAANNIIWLVLAQNRGFTVAQITNGTDANLQTAVEAAVNIMAGA